MHQSKTPNGRMKNCRRTEQSYDVFDMSRPELDVTVETALDASERLELSDLGDLGDLGDLSALDTSRPRDDLCPRQKLDDNMNAFRVDGGEVQPTLQPNG